MPEMWAAMPGEPCTAKVVETTEMSAVEVAAEMSAEVTAEMSATVAPEMATTVTTTAMSTTVAGVGRARKRDREYNHGQQIES